VPDELLLYVSERITKESAAPSPGEVAAYAKVGAKKKLTINRSNDVFLKNFTLVTS
jgi:hypothetical protein